MMQKSPTVSLAGCATLPGNVALVVKRQVQADVTDDTRRVVERLTGLPYERC